MHERCASKLAVLLTLLCLAANLASIMTVQKQAVIPITSVPGAIQQGAKICSAPGASASYVNGRYPTASPRIIQGGPWSEANLFTHLLASECDVGVATSANVQGYFSQKKYCGVVHVTTFHPGQTGWVSDTRTCLGRALLYAITKLDSTGTLDQLKDRWFPPTACSESSESASDEMGVEDMAGIFIINAAVLVITALGHAAGKSMATEADEPGGADCSLTSKEDEPGDSHCVSKAEQPLHAAPPHEGSTQAMEKSWLQEMVKQLFSRYGTPRLASRSAACACMVSLTRCVLTDLDSSGTLNHVDEVRMLVSNIHYKANSCGYDTAAFNNDLEEHLEAVRATIEKGQHLDRDGFVRWYWDLYVGYLPLIQRTQLGS